jgi:hypothetical protein
LLAKSKSFHWKHWAACHRSGLFERNLEISMALPFPTDDPFLIGYYEPIHMECDAPNLPVTGEVPKALRGTLYRN